MFTWKDYEVAEARRQQLLDEAAGQRQLAQAEVAQSTATSVLDAARNYLGSVLIDLGTRMQTCTDEMAESLQYAGVGSSAAAIHRAEQNC